MYSRSSMARYSCCLQSRESSLRPRIDPRARATSNSHPPVRKRDRSSGRARGAAIPRGLRKAWADHHPDGSTSAIGTKGADFKPWAADHTEHLSMLAEVLAAHDEKRLPTTSKRKVDILSKDFWRTKRRKGARSRETRLLRVGTTGAGVRSLLSGIADLFSPTVRGDPEAQPSGTVFKIERGTAREKVAYVRLFSGAVHPAIASSTAKGTRTSHRDRHF